jgi:hypothetical protein
MSLRTRAMLLRAQVQRRSVPTAAAFSGSAAGAAPAAAAARSMRQLSSGPAQKVMTGVQRAFAFGLFGITGLGSGLLLVTFGQSLSRFNENRQAQKMSVSIETQED